MYIVHEHASGSSRYSIKTMGGHHNTCKVVKGIGLGRPLVWKWDCQLYLYDGDIQHAPQTFPNVQHVMVLERETSISVVVSLHESYVWI